MKRNFELYGLLRKTWSVDPKTKVMPNKKKYSRKTKHRKKGEEYG